MKETIQWPYSCRGETGQNDDDDESFLLDTDFLPKMKEVNAIALFVLTDGQSSFKFSLYLY